MSSVPRTHAHRGSHLDSQRRRVLTAAFTCYLLGVAVAVSLMLSCQGSDASGSATGTSNIVTIQSEKPGTGDVTPGPENSGPNRSSDAGRSSSVTVEPVLSFEAHSSWIRSVQFSPVSDVLASGGRSPEYVAGAGGGTGGGGGSGGAGGSKGKTETLSLWDPATGERYLIISGERDEVRSLSFSNDGGRLAMGNEDGQIRIWKVRAELN